MFTINSSTSSLSAGSATFSKLSLLCSLSNVTLCPVARAIAVTVDSLGGRETSFSSLDRIWSIVLGFNWTRFASSY